MISLMATLLAGAASDPAYPLQLIIGPCSLPTASGWKFSAKGQLSQGADCATCQNPPGNGGFAYMAPCGNALPWQTWNVNKTRWSGTAPNVSMGIMLPAEAASTADFGFTYDKNADRANMKPGVHNGTAPIQIFDIGEQGRFPGECRGNNNCNWLLDDAKGQLKTFHGLCLATLPSHPPAPAPPVPAPPPPFAGTNASCTGGTGALCFSWAQGSHMVLQSTPAKSAVYGTVAGPASSKITVTVTPIGGGAAYTVPATVTAGAAGANTTWKAFLKPTPAGGNFTIAAKCSDGCTGQAAVFDVTFGDV